jgi:branched-chain amino acid transport system ATP-binding protein
LTGSTTKLAVRSLNAAYGRAHILFDVALDVGAGEATTLRSILGLVANADGEIVFDGAVISHLPPHERVRLGLGYVPEDRRIFSDLTVDQNLEVGRQDRREGTPQWTRERLFEIFPNLQELRSRLGGRMSGGEQQMLAIARTLMGNPSLNLLKGSPRRSSSK